MRILIFRLYFGCRYFICWYAVWHCYHPACPSCSMRLVLMSSYGVIPTLSYFLIGPYLRFQFDLSIIWIFRFVRMRISSLDRPSVFILWIIPGRVVFCRSFIRTYLSGYCEAPVLTVFCRNLIYQMFGSFRVVLPHASIIRSLDSSFLSVLSYSCLVSSSLWLHCSIRFFICQ